MGLGYVGLPLCLTISKKYKTIGFDISKDRITSLLKKKDVNKSDAILIARFYSETRLKEENWTHQKYINFKSAKFMTHSKSKQH